jgi:hypothetical protein
MHILMLCEGDAEMPQAFSGTGKSMVDLTCGTAGRRSAVKRMAKEEA